MTNRKTIGLLSASTLAAYCQLISAVHADVLKKEPPMGSLREGQRVLVDDGSCGPRKIKEVTGGNHVEVGGTKRIKRTYRCIKR
jgi:hypothetical protein